MSYTKCPPTGNNSPENDPVPYNPIHSTFTDYGSSDTYDLPPGPLSVFSVSLEDDEIVNLSDPFRQITPLHLLFHFHTILWTTKITMSWIVT